MRPICVALAVYGMGDSYTGGYVSVFSITNNKVWDNIKYLGGVGGGGGSGQIWCLVQVSQGQVQK